MSDFELIAECSQTIYDGFIRYNNAFHRLTRRARTRFEQRDWKGHQQDIVDRVDLYEKSVIYRPPTLVIGIGLHWDTSKEKILEGINDCIEKFGLSTMSIAKLVSIKKPQDVQGLIDVGEEMRIPVEYIDREELAKITAPNPSETVKSFEGTASVSEAAAILVSNGKLIVEKQKFPPDLTIAIARIQE